MAYPISDVPRRIVYSGSAGVGPYAFTFEVLANTDIAVYKNTTLLTLTTDYTVTINTGTGTGTVTLVVAATSADTVTIVGDRAIQRTSDFVTGGDLFANTLNNELDAQTIYTQQVDEKADRAIRSPVTDPTTISMVLPSQASRAQKLLGFNASGEPTTYVATTTVSDTSLINFTQAGTGAVTRTAQSKMREAVSVKDFGAVGDGVTNDRSAIQAAFDSGAKSIYFPSGTYFVGAHSSGVNIIDLSNAGAGLSIVTDKSVELVCQTTASVMPRFFYMFGNTNFSCGPIRFRDTGYDPLVSWKGAIGFFLDNNTGASGNWGDLNFDAIYGKNLVAVMQVGGGDATHRVRGIKIGQLFSDDCYYGFNAQNQGDGVAIDNLIAYQNYRPYFVYGCFDHNVKIFNRANRGTSGAVNISRSVGGLNTSGIDVTYVARDQTQGITHVLINHIDLLGGEISNIRVNIDIRSSVVYTPLRFVNYTGSGGSETSAASSNNVYDITLSGSCDVQANPVTSVASYALKRRLKFQSGLNFSYDTTILNLFYLDEAVRPLTPTWTASSVNPAIGNGSISNNVDVIDGILYNNVSLTAGSTTTFGTGEWSFGLPYTAKSTAVGTAWILDNGTAYYVGAVKIESGNATAQVFISGGVTAISSATPMTWANGDRLIFSLAYPIT